MSKVGVTYVFESPLSGRVTRVPVDAQVAHFGMLDREVEQPDTVEELIERRRERP